VEEAAAAERAQAAMIKKARRAACRVENSDEEDDIEAHDEDTNPVYHYSLTTY
jgi:hypothetical protein